MPGLKRPENDAVADGEDDIDDVSARGFVEKTSLHCAQLFLPSFPNIQSITSSG